MLIYTRILLVEVEVKLLIFLDALTQSHEIIYKTFPCLLSSVGSEVEVEDVARLIEIT